MPETKTVVSSAQSNTKLLTIGRIWNNVKTGDRMPAMSGRLDRDLPVSVTLSPNSRFVIFKNDKREGKQDADFRLAIVLDTDVADDIIKTQRANRAGQKALV